MSEQEGPKYGGVSEWFGPPKQWWCNDCPEMVGTTDEIREDWDPRVAHMLRFHPFGCWFTMRAWNEPLGEPIR